MLKKFFTTAAGIIFISLIAGAQNPEDKILPRKDFVESSLDNGLSYVLSHNASPSRMIECRLIFKAGSILEDESNRGAAHFLEHMAFGGTKHFPNRELVDYLESLGAQYGISINAYTGYDRTIYMFAIPSDDREGLDNALRILRDWLVNITLEPKKVEGEKGIILEELRGYDVGDEFYDLKIGTGRYSEGIPLGTAEQISAITPEILKDFHKKWYTLGQATVAIVGDIDVKDVQKRIRKVFGPLKASSSPDYRDYSLDYAEGTTVKSINDTLAKRMSADLIVPHKATFKRTLADAVHSERARMLVRAASRRLYKTGHNASLTNHWYLADKEHFVISASGKNKHEIQEELTDAIAELYRITEDGFCDGEMNEIRKAAKSMTVLPNGTSSAMLCDEISETALFDDRAVTDEAQLEFLRKELESTTSEDLQKILSGWLDAAENTRLLACTFNAHTSEEIRSDDIDRIWAEAQCRECRPYVYEEEVHETPSDRVAVPDFLTEQKPFDPAMIYSRTYYPNIGVTSIYLNNGFRFVLRPTADEEHKIQMQLFAPGGLSRIPEDEFPVYEGIASQMDMSGIERMDEDEFSSLLMEHEIGIITTMENYWHGFIASAPKESAALMFNAIKERMYRPKLNYENFEEMKQSDLDDFESGEESYLSRLLKNDVQRQLNMRIDSLMGNLLYGRRTDITREDIERRNLDLMADFYKKLYCNPDGMTCVVCGDFDVDSLIYQAVPVFAEMQKTGEANKMGDSHFKLPVTTRHITYPNANESQTMFDYIRFGQYEPSLRSGLKLKLMNNLIRNRLLTVLREQESLVYSPYASLFYTAAPDRIFYIDINASVDRQNTKKVHKILDSIINDLQHNQATERELNTLKRIFIVNKRNTLEENATAAWKGYLVGQIKNDETLVELDMYEDVLESITAEELRREFIKCFDTDKYMILSMGDF